MSVVEKIAARLSSDHDIVLPPDTELRRLGGGQWARAQGRWSWSLWSPSAPSQAPYGSQYPATELLRCQNWEVEKPTSQMPDASIWPCTDCQQHGMGTCKKQRTCLHCEAEIEYVTGFVEPRHLPRDGWSDGKRSPFYCPKARDLTHVPKEA